MNEQMTLALFKDVDGVQRFSENEELCSGAVLLRGGFVRFHQALLLESLQVITAGSSFRHMITPGGFCMSVALTNCGSYGWVSDRRGYRCNATDPESGKPWPSMPAVFLKLAQEAAMYAGFKNYVPDACLVNRYEPGARLSLHQDRNERDLSSPIVSVSLGIPAIFLWGGLRRKDKPIRILLMYGDVMVWGGPARLHYHEVLAIK